MKKLFVLFLCLFVSDSFASGIASNSASAPCTNNTLETYSGNSNLAADWAPNTIQLRWYNENEKLTVQQSAQTCTYDGTLTVPQTPPTRTGYTFAGWTVRMPGTYTELEYIESTGTQYIDTGVVPTLMANFDVGYMYRDGVGQTNAGQVVFGIRNDPLEYTGFLVSSFRYDKAGVVNAGVIPNNGYVRLGSEGSGSYYLPQQDNTFVSLRSDTDGYIYFNGSKLSDTPLTRANHETNLTIYMFRLHAAGSGATDYAKCRIYYLRLYDNTTLVRNFIPARRNSDNVLGMYDTVTQTFFTNAGTGTFTAGPVVQ